MAIDASKLRHGRVRGRYFRENFAQAGIDLTQIIPEQLLVHRELELLRVAGRRTPRNRSARRRHIFQVHRRAAKLEAAKRLVAYDPSYAA